MVGYSKASTHPTLDSYPSFSSSATSYRYTTLDTPCPTGTFTRQEMPSFAWRTHATLASA